MAAPGDGSSILSKSEVTFFNKNVNFVHQGFLPQFKKNFIIETPFAEHILLGMLLFFSFQKGAGNASPSPHLLAHLFRIK